jgi:transmembrane sensor
MTQTRQTARDPADLLRLEQAAEWLQRMHTAADDESVLEQWLEWCQRDPRNQQAFDEMAAVWEITGQLSAEGAGSEQAKVSRWPRRALAASVGALALSAVAGLWWSNHQVQPQVLTREYDSPVGANTTHTLADGSLLELGGGTHATVTISARARRVELHQGELFVAVRKDASRPFAVDAGRLEVVATGTAFNVRRTVERTTVTVAEGSVEALYEGQAATVPNVRLNSHRELIYNHAAHSFIQRDADLRVAMGWRSGEMQFEDQPLSEVIATINRYSSREIVIDDPQVRGLSFTGTARTDRIEGWLRGLPYVFPVAVAELPDGRQVIRSRPGARTD